MFQGKTDHYPRSGDCQGKSGAAVEAIPDWFWHVSGEACAARVHGAWWATNGHVAIRLASKPVGLAIELVALARLVVAALEVGPRAVQVEAGPVRLRRDVADPFALGMVVSHYQAVIGERSVALPYATLVPFLFGPVTWRSSQFMADLRVLFAFDATGELVAIVSDDLGSVTSDVEGEKAEA
jgi:tetrahydromethanopterin S-methyltransferase subunit E